MSMTCWIFRLNAGIAMVVACLVAVGCSTNPKLAVIKAAREYALEKHPDLSEASIHTIKFKAPMLRQELIFEEEAGGSKNDLMQTCVVWDMPKNEYDGKQLVVVGFGERDLRDWYPIRAFLKRYRELEPPKKKKPASFRTRKRRLKRPSGTLNLNKVKSPRSSE